MDVLHGAIEGALDAGMTPSDIELMAATIHRSRNQAAEYVGDLEAEVADLERCPDHPEDRLRRRTKLRSLLRIAEPVGDEVFYCVGDSGPCSWVHSR